MARRAFVWGFSALGVLAVAAFLAASLTVYRYGDRVMIGGWGVAPDGATWRVVAVRPGSPSDGKLQVGDRLVAVDGDRRHGVIGPWVRLQGLADGGVIRLRVERAGVEHEYAIRVEHQHDRRVLSRRLVMLIVAGAWLAVALFIGLMRPDQPTARLAAIVLLASALVHLTYQFDAARPFLSRGLMVAGYVVGVVPPLHLALGLHFAYRFPPTAPQTRGWRRLVVAVYVLAGIIVLGAAIPFAWAGVTDPSSERLVALLAGAPGYFRLHARLSDLLWPLALIAMTVVVVRNYRTLEGADERRRLRWVLVGALVGLAPSVVLEVLHVLEAIGGFVALSPATETLSLWAVNVATVVIPVSMAYAILKHRVFSIHVVVRRGVKYVLAKNALRVLVALPAAVLVYAIVINRDRTVAELLLENSKYLYLIAIAAASLGFRRQVSAWIDRQFFRDAYDRERILVDLLEQIDKIDSVAELSKLVSAQLDRAFHPKSVYVWYRPRQARDLELAYSSDAALPGVRLADDTALVRAMQHESGARDLASLSDVPLTAPERAWLDRAGVALVVPLLAGDRRLAGLLMLGEKKSEEPYGHDDRQFLQAIAMQIGVVHENAALKARVGEEQRIRQEVLARLDDRAVNVLKECPACGACFDSQFQFCEQDGTELTLSLPIERVVEGKYRLDRLLGKGGMGAVYEAEDLRLGRKVALKVMVGRAFGDQVALRRFEREARASARLSHPNIITIYDYGAVSGQGGYLVMERLHGTTLRDELKRRGAIDPQTAADWFDQVSEAMKTAHAAGVIHRDLKPENILITGSEGRRAVKVLDFGLAKLREQEIAASLSITEPGMVLGTFGYTSPEQLSGGEVDERSDVFSIGVMVAEALTGKRPFRGKTFSELLSSMLNDRFTLPEQTAAARRLEAALQRCLATEPAARFASVAAMQAELIPAIRQADLHRPAAPQPTDSDALTI